MSRSAAEGPPTPYAATVELLDLVLVLGRDDCALDLERRRQLARLLREVVGQDRHLLDLLDAGEVLVDLLDVGLIRAWTSGLAARATGSSGRPCSLA